MTESEFLKGSADVRPRIFSESDLKFSKQDEVLYQRLTPEGELRGNPPDITPQALRRMYDQLVFGRLFDEKATNMSTIREIGTYAPCKGQEGSQIGAANALEKGD